LKKPTPSYKRYRFPSEIISHAIWLYHRFCLSFREMEELLAERGLAVTYEIVRQQNLFRLGRHLMQAFNYRLY
jgi:transposase-like protein